MPGGFVTITHMNPTGENDTAVRVYFSLALGRDTICVSAVTPCSQSLPKTVAISALQTPPAVSSITGSLTPCIENIITYTASAPAPTSIQSSIYKYRWTKPNYTTITSASADSSTISLQYNIGFTGGTISVKGQSACNISGTVKTITLQYLPPTPTGITSRTGTTNACIGDTITYSVVVPAPTATQRAASVYRWIKPNNTQILNANADSSSIRIKFNVGYTGGAISVKGQTICGAQGAAKTVTLSHTGCPTGLTNLPTAKTISQYEVNIVSVSPNPSQNSFTFNQTMKTSMVNQSTQVELMNVNGIVIKRWNINNPTFVFGDDLQAGVYLLRSTCNGMTTTKKIIKQ